MSKPIEEFIFSINVRWADCDPALIAYTGRVPYFALESIEAWWEHFVGMNWFVLNLDRGIGTPFAHMSFDFRSPITPRHQLQCQVKLLKIGSSSLRFSVCGRQNGVLCFEGEFVSVIVVSKSLRPQPVPAEILKIIRPLVAVD